MYIDIQAIYQANCANLFSNGDIMFAGVHVGNSDLVGEFVYECSEQLVASDFEDKDNRCSG